MSFNRVIKRLMSSDEVKSIHDEIRGSYFDEFGWTEGGCFALAEAISSAIPEAQLWVVASKEEKDWAAGHAFVKFRGRFYDADGLKSKEDLLKQFGQGRNTKIGQVTNDWLHADIPDSLWYPEQEFVSDKEISYISKLVAKIAKEEGVQ